MGSSRPSSPRRGSPSQFRMSTSPLCFPSTPNSSASRRAFQQAPPSPCLLPLTLTTSSIRPSGRVLTTARCPQIEIRQLQTFSIGLIIYNNYNSYIFIIYTGHVHMYILCINALLHINVFTSVKDVITQALSALHTRVNHPSLDSNTAPQTLQVQPLPATPTKS